MPLQENNEALQLGEAGTWKPRIYKTKQICNMDYKKIDPWSSSVAILRNDSYSLQALQRIKPSQFARKLRKM